MALLLCAASLSTIAVAQSYPTKPVRIIVGYPAGGPTDMIARTVAQKLSPALGQQVIVDNRPGASGMIGAELAVKAPPDGYSLLVSTDNLWIGPFLQKVPYDPIRDFVALAAATIDVQRAATTGIAATGGLDWHEALS